MTRETLDTAAAWADDALDWIHAHIITSAICAGIVGALAWAILRGSLRADELPYAIIGTIGTCAILILAAEALAGARNDG